MRTPTAIVKIDPQHRRLGCRKGHARLSVAIRQWFEPSSTTSDGRGQVSQQILWKAEPQSFGGVFRDQRAQRRLALLEDRKVLSPKNRLLHR